MEGLHPMKVEETLMLIYTNQETQIQLEPMIFTWLRVFTWLINLWVVKKILIFIIGSYYECIR